jgi:hypothetical protein
MSHDVNPEPANTQNGDADELLRNGHEDTSPAGGDAGTDAENDAQRMQAKGRFSDPELARKAAQARWAKHRAPQLDAEIAAQADGDDVLMVYVPLPVAKIVRAYIKAAEKGNANAGRELRSWLEKYPPRDECVDIAQLDRDMRDAILARLVREVEEERAAIEHNPSGTRGSFDQLAHHFSEAPGGALTCT